LKRVLVTALLVGVATPATAQVNTEKLRSTGTEGFSGAVDFSLFVRRGNVDLTRVGTGLRTQYETLHAPEATTSTTVAPRRRPKDLVLLIGNLTLGIRKGERYLNDGFSHLRWTRMWIPVVGSEIFAQAQYNEFLRLRQRVLLGAGARATPIDASWGEISLGTAAMFELEEIDEELGIDEPTTTVGRWSNYLSLKLYLGDPNVGVVNTIYVQPRLDEFSDYRVLSEGEVTVGVTEALAFVVSVSILYDSEPPEAVEKLDLTIKNSLSVSF
jgi:hypothetical protein